jgi:hypothetical protein
VKSWRLIDLQRFMIASIGANSLVSLGERRTVKQGFTLLRRSCSLNSNNERKTLTCDTHGEVELMPSATDGSNEREYTGKQTLDRIL